MWLFLWLVGVFLLGASIGWSLRDETARTQLYWATRPHIPGIECPTETQCRLCFYGKIQTEATKTEKGQDGETPDSQGESPQDR